MDVVEQFASLVARSPDEVPLDEAALLIAARARGAASVDRDGTLSALDDLARRCELHTFDGVRAHLFERERFRGNAAHYDDPDNSFLDRVVDRRLGIPITLSAVMIEVGRRIGVPIVGIGMPAHFIVRAADDDVYCDPFNGGQLLDERGCADLFATVTRGRAVFDRSLLAPVSAPQVLSRMLTNIEHGPFAADPVRLAALLDLHLAIPTLTAAERVALSTRLASVGRYGEAATVVETVGDQHARAFRARLN
jgi:regulator of sirC expression with transglutaminase-like and TPR domain